MTVSTINIGNIANDGTGDDLREAFIKVNNNFLELEARNPEQTTASNQFADASGTAGIFKEKDGFNLKFKNITAGNNITLTTDDNQITIDTTGIVSIQYTADAGVINPLGATDLFKFTGTGGASATAWSVGYTGVEGLSVDYAQGETETVSAPADATTFKASYAYSSFTLSYSDNEYDTDATTGGQDIESWNLAYTVSDDLSIAYGTETHDAEGSSVDEEVEYFNVSYTTGGVTLSASQYNFEGDGNIAGTAGEKERWALSATFAF